MRISVASMVQAAPPVVFGTVADVPRWPQFMSAIDGVEMLTPGSVGVGTRFRETRKMFGRSTTEEMTVAEVTPPRRFVLTALSHGTDYRAEHIIEASGAGSRLTLVFEARPMGFFARLMAPIAWLFLGSVKRQLASDLEDVKREAERRHRES